MEANFDYGARFRAEREKVFPTVTAAAEALGIERAYLSKLESGSKRPSFDLLERMALCYGCLPGDLLPTSKPNMADLEGLATLLYGFRPGFRRQIVNHLTALARSMGNGIEDILSSQNVTTHQQAGPYTSETQPHDDAPFGPVYPGRGVSLEDSEGAPGFRNVPRRKASYTEEHE